MGYEVEVKYRTDSHAELLGRLDALGAVPGSEMSQQDTYLSHPCRDFAQTKEALRIRRIGDANRITYKGPRLAGPTKTREEIELAFAEGEGAYEQLLRLYTNLGFRPVAVIRKTRRPYGIVRSGRELEVVLDVAEGLGEFAEVEAFAEAEADLPLVQAAVLELASSLGLTQVEPRSYLRMALEAQAQTNRG